MAAPLIRGVVCLLLSLFRVTSGNQYMIQASLMGFKDKTDVELYREIADILMREEGSRDDSQNYCSLHFNKVIFDKTNGSTMFHSLTAARKNFMDKKVAVAIGPYIDVFTSTDYVISNQLHLLTSAAGHNSRMMDPEWALSILPEQDSLSTAVADIVMKLKWKTVALLSQDDFSPVLTLGRHGIQVWPIRLPTTITSHQDFELQRNLIELRSSQKNKFILHSTKKDIVEHVMVAANRLHLLHHSIDWFITYPDFKDVIRVEDSWPGSIYGLQLLREDKLPKNISHVVERNMSRLEMALAVDAVGLLHHVLYRVAQNCSEEPKSLDYVITADQFVENLKYQSPTTSYQRYQGALGQYQWSQEQNARTNYSLDVLWYRNKREKIASCNFVNGTPTLHFYINVTENPPSGNVFGKDVVRIVLKQDDPFVMKRGNEYVGFSKDLLDNLAERLEFQYEIYDVTDHYKNGQINEIMDPMVQELLAGNASIAVGALEVTAQREEVIDYSFTILSTKASILIQKPKTPQNFFQFLGPFSSGLWFMIVGFFVITGATLYLMNRFDHTQTNAEKQFDLKESIWYSLNVLLQGTTDYSPQTTSMRTIIAFFWFCVLIIDAAYTANLAAYLTLQQIDERIRTVYDLSIQTKIKYGVEKNSNLMYFLQTATGNPYERMWAFIKIHEAHTLIANKTEMIERVQNGSFAFISDGLTNEYYAKQHCGMESLEQNFAQKDFSFGFPRGAPYRDDVNRALLELREDGILDILTRKWWEEGKNCSDDSQTRSVSHKMTAELELTNMFGVFIVLGGFVVLAVIVEIVERILHCCDNHRLAKKKKVDLEEEKPKLEGYDRPQLNALDARIEGFDSFNLRTSDNSPVYGSEF